MLRASLHLVVKRALVGCQVTVRFFQIFDKAHSVRQPVRHICKCLAKHIFGKHFKQFTSYPYIQLYIVNSIFSHFQVQPVQYFQCAGSPMAHGKQSESQVGEYSSLKVKKTFGAKFKTQCENYITINSMGFLKFELK